MLQTRPSLPPQLFVLICVPPPQLALHTLHSPQEVTTQGGGGGGGSGSHELQTPLGFVPHGQLFTGAIALQRSPLISKYPGGQPTVSQLPEQALQ